MDRANASDRPRERFPPGWRRGILTGSILAIAVFVLNLAVTIAAGASSHNGPDQSRKLLFEGNCDSARQLNEGLHLVINVLSTVLLSASNYGMQCLSAPTRSEIDKAHEKGHWLDIGVLSFRNLSSISWRRSFLWLCLGISSLPLHLFYNSAVYTSVYASDYAIFEATEDMLLPNASSQDLGISTFNFNTTRSNVEGSTINATASLTYSSAVAGNLTRLDIADCIAAYASTFQTGWGNVILVTSDSQDVPFAWIYSNYDGITPTECAPDPFGWICGHTPASGVTWDCAKDPTCPSQVAKVDQSDWEPFGSKIDYCLAEKLDQRCTVEFSTELAAIVIVFNFVKAAILLYTLIFVKEAPLMTLGDAIASFLCHEDQTTRSLCLMSRTDIRLWEKSKWHSPQERQSVAFRRNRTRWYKVISGPRWTTLWTLYIVIIAVCVFLFVYGITESQASPSTMMSLAFGAVDPLAFIQDWNVPSSGATALIYNVLVANSPQPILSMIYFSYNGVFTLFLLGSEWNNFESHKKGLRVSSKPKGAQRSTYTLQLPKRWALPLMGLSTLLHWLCSQSIFLVNVWFDSSVSAAEFDGEPDCSNSSCLSEFLTCGYSPIAILTTIIMGLAMVALVAVVGCRRYRNGGIPLAGSCSASISACCHLINGPNAAAMDAAPDGVDAAEPLLEHANPFANVELDDYSAVTHDGQWYMVLQPLQAENTVESTAQAAHLQPVKWGAVDDHDTGDQVTEREGTSLRTGHCSFSSGEVSPPRDGHMYAGII